MRAVGLFDARIAYKMGGARGGEQQFIAAHPLRNGPIHSRLCSPCCRRHRTGGVREA
jgi:hypothetical protein